MKLSELFEALLALVGERVPLHIWNVAGCKRWLIVLCGLTLIKRIHFSTNALLWTSTTKRRIPNYVYNFW
jgi:hypothetical protein